MSLPLVIFFATQLNLYTASKKLKSLEIQPVTGVVWDV
jgi:hypothetical protein